MEHDFIYMPKAERIEVEYTIADFIPFGRENAIPRKKLAEICVSSGLIDEDNKDVDRQMRYLLQKARIDYTILNRSEGGYYRPTHDDLLDLKRYINQEKKRAKAIFKDVQHAQRLYEDLLKGRLDAEE